MKPIIDVSSHNGQINWKSAKNHIHCAIIRIGYRGYTTGKIQEDYMWDYNHQMAEAAGVAWSPYFFPCSINTKEAIEEAIWIMDKMHKYVNLPMAIWLDSEIADVKGKKGRSDNLAYSVRSEILYEIRDTIKSVCPHWAVGFYASDSWFKDHLDYIRLQREGTPLWIARYGKTPSINNYVAWQYTSKGHIPGISGHVDLSVLKGQKIF